MEIIFDNIEVIKKRARAQDPATSVAAAERSVRFSNSHSGRIMAALECLGNATAHELGKHTGLSIVQVDRRLPELRRDGMADVLQLAGEDVVREGYRVWRLGKKFCGENNKT